jgi:hypothetical protein
MIVKPYYITFRSVTYAQRGERVLQNAGIRSVLQRSPAVIQERGCGYSLAVGPGDLNRALGLLLQGSVPFRKVYVREGEGVLREVTL